MQFDKNISYKCVMCKEKYTNTLHEIFYGTANRKISIKYNLQVPLCNDCHIKAHSNKWLWELRFCEMLGISWLITKTMINNFKENKEYFEGIKDKCLEKLNNGKFK